MWFSSSRVINQINLFCPFYVIWSEREVESPVELEFDLIGTGGGWEGDGGPNINHRLSHAGLDTQ